MTDKLSFNELSEIAEKVGSARAIMREKTAKECGIDLEQNDQSLLRAMEENPNLIQRPILIKGDKATVGRPIEAMLALK